MLILTRRVSQSFLIMPHPRLDLSIPIGEFFASGPIEVAVTQVSGARVKFSVVADQRLLILRDELRRHDDKR
jgi:sRNA-binding carbon storage regulator CsrA